MTKPSRLLAAVDFSLHGRRVLDAACALAGDLGAPRVVVHAIEPLHVTGSHHPEARAAVEKAKSDVRTAATMEFGSDWMEAVRKRGSTPRQ